MTPQDNSLSTPDPRFEIPVTRWALWLSAFLVFLVIMSGTVRYSDGDSRYALVASMGLLEHGSMQLDPYADELDLSALNNGHFWMVFHSGDGGHLYYDYPVGTPIFSTPFVFIGRMLGMNPLQREDDNSLQMAIAAILCVTVFLLLFRLSNLYLGDWAALIFALAIFFGSTLSSTLGTALWSQNFQTIFVLLILLELAEWERGKRADIRGIWLGAILFAAYLCRPTSAALILPVFGYLAWRNRKALPWTMGTAAVLFLSFVLWSWLEMHMLLPRYYDPTMWQTTTEFWPHWLPLWFGPARGLWAFTPVMLILWGAWAMRKLRFQPLHLLFWVWIVLHTFLLARSQSPWGGWSYGPRFFTEIVPGMALVLLLMAGEWESFKPSVRKAMLGFFVVASAAGIYIHTLQGLYNIETVAWNDNPNIDQHWKERRWDWQHPQFLASGHQRLDMIAERGIALTAHQALRRLPEGANVLLGAPDPLARELYARWNRQDRFGRKQKLYNSMHAMQADGVHECYFNRSLLPEILKLPNVKIDSAIGYRLCFGEFLAANKAHEIIAAAKDDCTTGAALETRAYMYSIHSRFDSVRLRQSYIVHIKNGQVIHEAYSDNRLDYDLPGNPHVHATSAGIFVGNYASINVDGQECSMNERGMNVVVLDEKRKVIWTASFDTHGDDHEKVSLMKAKWGN